MTRTRRSAPALIAVVVLAVAACGGSSGLSKDEFIEQGDALCQRFQDETDEVAEPETEEELVEYLDEVIGIAQSTQEDFEALDPPEGGESVHEALVDSLEKSIAKVREARDAFEDDDQEAFEAAFEEAVELGEASDEEAKAYGFEVCGSESEDEEDSGSEDEGASSDRVAQSNLRNALSAAKTIATDYEGRFLGPSGAALTPEELEAEEGSIDFVESGQAGPDTVSVKVTDGDDGPNSRIYLVAQGESAFFCVQTTSMGDVYFGQGESEDESVATCDQEEWR